MKSFLRSIYSYTDNTSGVLIEDEFKAANQMQNALKELVSFLEQEIREEQSKFVEKKEMSPEERASSRIIIYDISFLKNLHNLCSNINISLQYYISQTLNFNKLKARRHFDSGDDSSIKRKRQEIQLQSIPPHEIKPYKSSNVKNSVIKKIKNIDSHLRDEQIYVKLLSIDKDFSRNILILMCAFQMKNREEDCHL